MEVIKCEIVIKEIALYNNPWVALRDYNLGVVGLRVK